MTNHKKIYDYAKYYDIAFDFRDIPKECDFITEVYRKQSKKEPESVLELAAGPAYHAIEFAKRGLKSTALDSNQAMVDYGLNTSKSKNASLEYVCADMIDFRIQSKFDIALLLMASAYYLLDNESVYKHFNCVAEALNPGGIYILEMDHPCGVFGVKKSAENNWETERDGVKVTTKWGNIDDYFDPITQITETTVTMDYKDGEKKGTIIDISRSRNFTANEFKALVDASAVFKIVNMYGAIELKIPFDNSKEAWRMVPVLQKV